MNGDLRAFDVVWRGWPHVHGIYAARSRGRAHYLAALSLADTTGRSVGRALAESRCVRAPEYDLAAIRLGREGPCRTP